MALFFDALLLLSLFLWVMRAVEHGAISVNHAALVLVVLAALVGVSRAMGISLARLVFRVAVPVVSLLIFLIWNTDGSSAQMASLFFALLPVIIAMLGIYIMFRGGFKNNPKQR